MTTLIKRYTISDAAKLDKEARQLVNVFSVAKIKIGLELASRLKEIEDNRLYEKLDDSAYKTFPQYLDSLNIKYKTAREIIGLYETYVLTAGMSVDELTKIAYHKLTTIKPFLFSKEAGEYKLIKPKEELHKWIADAKSDMTHDDLMQKRRELEAGEHTHDFYTIRVCKICRLKEIYNDKT
jgi:hypothetical protein